ncbi:hypothetical protein Btru_031739 [Bulinus truncatus]|nr:hypothetical protein Btru_031739 [Bulinus truncatus]
MSILDKAPLLSAGDLMKVHGSMYKYGVLRMKKSGLHLGKWAYRFLVLTRHFLYIYKNEQAARPKHVLSLREYHQVQSSEADACAWCFNLMTSPHASRRAVRGETFSCVSEDDRKGWVAALLTQISLTADELGVTVEPGSEPACHTYEDMRCARAGTPPAVGPTTIWHVRKKPIDELSTAAHDLSQPIVYLATEDLKSPKPEAQKKGVSLQKGIFPDSLDIPEIVRESAFVNSSQEIRASEDLASRVSSIECRPLLTALHQQGSDSPHVSDSEESSELPELYVNNSIVIPEPHVENSIPLRNSPLISDTSEDESEDYVIMNSPQDPNDVLEDFKDKLYVNYQKLVTGAEDHKVVTGAEDQQLVTGAEDQKLVTGAEDNKLVTGAEDQQLVTGAEDHKLVTGAEDHKLVTGAEDHKLVTGAEDHKLVTGVEDQKLLSCAEDHKLVTGAEDHKLVTGAEDRKLVTGAEDHKLVTGAEDRKLVTGAEDRKLVTGAEDRKLVTGAEDRKLVTGAEDRKLVTGAEDRKLVTGAEDRKLVTGAEDRKLVTGAEDHKLVTGAEDRKLVTGAEDRKLVTGAEDRNLVTGAQKITN